MLLDASDLDIQREGRERLERDEPRDAALQVVIAVIAMPEERRPAPLVRRKRPVLGRADEVADAVVFLLSDAASLFLGQTLNPNAGGDMP